MILGMERIMTSKDYRLTTRIFFAVVRGNIGGRQDSVTLSSWTEGGRTLKNMLGSVGGHLHRYTHRTHNVHAKAKTLLHTKVMASRTQ